MLNVIKKLATDEQGQGMAEYGLILAGVAVLVIGAIFGLGDRVKNLFEGLKFEKPAAGG